MRGRAFPPVQAEQDSADFASQSTVHYRFPKVAISPKTPASRRRRDQRQIQHMSVAAKKSIRRVLMSQPANDGGERGYRVGSGAS